MATEKMTAEERRAYMEQAIDEGGSVLHQGRVITSKADLPSKGDLATNEKERDAALSELDQRRAQLNEEEARIRSADSGKEKAPAKVTDSDNGKSKKK